MVSWPRVAVVVAQIQDVGVGDLAVEVNGRGEQVHARQHLGEVDLGLNLLARVAEDADDPPVVEPALVKFKVHDGAVLAPALGLQALRGVGADSGGLDSRLDPARIWKQVEEPHSQQLLLGVAGE